MVPSLRLSTQGDIAVLHESNVNGRWLIAAGPSFPVAGGQIPRPHDGALFFRHDLDSWYTWNESTAAWIAVGGSGAALTVQEKDGSPSVTNTSTLQFDQADGFVVTEPAPGSALVNMSAATTTAKGIVELATSGESAANVVVQGNDARMSDARTPSAHASSHQNAGGDEVATATPGANAIPKAGAGGTLATGWLPAGTTSALGTVELATDGEVAANVVVQGNDGRLQNRSRTRGCKVTHSANQSIANLTITALAFDTERYDYPGWHSNVTNNTRITVDATAVCDVFVSWAYAINATGERAWDIRINATNYIVGTTLSATSGAAFESANGPAVQHEFTATDYVESVALQTSGGALNINKSANYSPEMSVSLRAA